MQAYSASLRGKFASQTLPPPYEGYLICSAYPWRSVFSSAPLSTPRWQSIFIPAQGSSYTIKTVGGEAVRRFFSLKYAVLLYTISTLFTDPSLRKQNTSGKFLRSFFQKATASPRVPASLRVLWGWAFFLFEEIDLDSRMDYRTDGEQKDEAA